MFCFVSHCNKNIHSAGAEQPASVSGTSPPSCQLAGKLLRWPGTCPALLGGSQLPGRVEAKPQGCSSQWQMPGALLAHAHGDNLSHLPPRQASHKKPTKPRFSYNAGMLHRVSPSEGHLPEEKGFPGDGWGGSTVALGWKDRRVCLCLSGHSLSCL